MTAAPLCACVVVALHWGLAEGTEIKWQGNHDDTDHDPAKTAPRSQKYWDEHNIQRPDYGKTDAEAWAERQNEQSSSWWMHPFVGFVIVSFVVGMMAGLVFLQQMRSIKGERLGGGSGSVIKPWSLDDQALEDKIRLARLERFQANAPKEE